MSPESIGVVGAGLMGSGIAEAVARARYSVLVHEPERGPLQRSRERIDASLQQAVSRGKLDAAEAESVRARLTWVTDVEALSGCPVVIEAVTEDAGIKGAVLECLDSLVSESALLATNTSSIPIAQLAARTRRPERVIGLHFFAPVPVMKLVEIVVGLQTSADVIERAVKFARMLGKHPIRTRDRSGFIVNMLLVPYLISAVRMLEEGFASREDIDDGMKLGCGHPMGPLALCDFIGLDVLHAICESLYAEFRRVDFAPPPLLTRMVMSGQHGRKSGRGFYEHAAPAVAAS